MKMLKIVLISLLVIFLASFAGLYFFLKTMDINPYLTSITKNISQKLGRSCSVGAGDIDISFRHGIQLSVQDVFLADSAAFSSEPLVFIKEINLRWNFSRWITLRQFHFFDLILKSPRIHLVKDTYDRLNIMALSDVQPTGDSSPKEESSSMAILPLFFIGQITFEDAELDFLDLSTAQLKNLSVNNLDLQISNLSLNKTFSISGAMGLFSKGQNVSFSSNGAFDIEAKRLALTDFKAKTDLNQWDIKEIETTLPELKEQGARKILGKVKVDFPQINILFSGDLEFDGQVILEGGEFWADAFYAPIKEVFCEVQVDESQLMMERASLKIFDGLVKAKGSAKNFMSLQPWIGLEIEAAGLDVGQLSKGVDVSVGADGLLDVTLNGSVILGSKSKFFTSLKGGFKAELRQGIIQGGNVLTTGMGKIPLMQQMWPSIYESLPGDIQSSVDKNITLLDKGMVEGSIENMKIQTDVAHIQTPEGSVVLNGTIPLRGTLAMSGDLFLNSKLSQLFFQKASDFEVLFDEQGRIHVPLAITGTMENPVIQPNIDFVVRKMLKHRAQKELNKVFDKHSDVQGALDALWGGSQKESESQSGQRTVEQGVQKLFDKLFD